MDIEALKNVLHPDIRLFTTEIHTELEASIKDNREFSFKKVLHLIIDNRGSRLNDGDFAALLFYIQEFLSKKDLPAKESSTTTITPVSSSITCPLKRSIFPEDPKFNPNSLLFNHELAGRVWGK